MKNKSRIIVVDDELGPRESLRMILKDHYDVVTAADARQAFQSISDHEFDLAILDIRMPDINGIDLLKMFKEKAPCTEVIMITAYASVDTATEALRRGAFDYLIKPFDLSSVLDVVKKAINRRQDYLSVKEKISDLQLANKSLEDEIEATYRNIQGHYEETISSLVAAVDAKDSYTKGHQERVARLVSAIGHELGLEQKDMVSLNHAATLHDIGKIGVPEGILRKKGYFTADEYETVKKHAQIGAEILSPVKYLKDVIPLVMHHHEWYDGSGYPAGLAGENIPLGAKIIAIADAVDAMISERPYASSRSLSEVKEELGKVAGVQFDPYLVRIVLDNNFFNLYQ
jgi:putative two-component system response regulator